MKVGNYWVRTDWSDGWILATVGEWTKDGPMYASLAGSDEPWYEDEFKNAEWREIPQPLD